MPLTHFRLLETRLASQSPRLRTLPHPTYHRIHALNFSTIRASYKSSSAVSQIRTISISPCPPLRPSTRPVFTAMASLTQNRAHAGHAHSHGHSHSNVYLTSSNKNDAGVRITRIGLLVNLGMAIVKGVGGWLFHSQALIADAFHSLTDLVSDFMTLATISWSLKPPTERFPTGYGKIESLGALGVSGLLLFGGIAMGMNGIDTLYIQTIADASSTHGDHVHGLFGIAHGHSHNHEIPSLNAAWLAAGSIVIKEWLYRATMKIAKERKSSVLASNAVHHRVDSLTGIVAFLTIGGSHFISNAAWLDPVGGLIIAGMVIRAGWSNTKSSLLELADTTVDDDIKQSIQRSATKALRGVPAEGIAGVTLGEQVEIKEIQGYKSGQNYLMDIALSVPSTFTVADTTTIEEAVRKRVGTKIRGVRRLRVKFVPQDTDNDLKEDYIGVDISPRSSPEPEDEGDHNHSHAHDHSGHAHADDVSKKTR